MQLTSLGFVVFLLLACEQALLFGQAKRASRERASEGRSRETAGETRGFAARSRVLARLASLAQIGELARRLSCFIPRLNFFVRYGSDPSPEIFFVGKHAGRSKDPRCENWNCQEPIKLNLMGSWNCQLLARFLHPQMKIQIVFRKLLQYRH